MESKPEKSPNDYRDYRIILLENNIKVLLISDINKKDKETEKSSAETKKAAAALCIKVGSFQDPQEVEGLAHFLEHMVFMGSEKYPKENEFESYLKQYGGYSNACTDNEKTIFHFDVLPENFEGALDRFAQFFVNPLLLEDAVDREIKAVDSEFKGVSQKDGTRIAQVLSHIAKKDHPHSRFTWGNKESLSTKPKEQGIDVMKNLREFFNKYYLNSSTTLALCSTESLDTLEDWCRKYFSSLSKRQEVSEERLSSNVYNNPFEIETFHKLYYVTPVRDYHLLEFNWIVPSQLMHYKGYPMIYFGTLLDHKGKGSIYDNLRQRGFISSLYSYVEDYSEYDNIFFTLELTDKGIDHIEEIVHIVFQYLSMLKRNGASKRVCNEIKHATDISFRFLEPDEPHDYVETLVEYMQEYPDDDWITCSVGLQTDFQDKVIETFQEYLSPETVNIIVSSKKLQHLSRDHIEPWFRTRYSVTEIPASWLDPEQCQKENESLHFPDPNRFLAEKFDIKKAETKDQLYPKLICENEHCRVWFKQDSKFCLPKAIGQINVLLPNKEDNFYNVCSSMLYWVLEYMSAGLNHEAWLAMMSQSSYHIISGHRFINISGFNDKLLPVFKKHIDSLSNFEFTLQAFDTAKENQLRALKNTFIDVDNFLSLLCSLVMDKRSWNYMEMIKVLQDLTPEQFKKFVKEDYFSKKLGIECLFQGNLLAEEVMAYVDYLRKELPGEEIVDVDTAKFKNRTLKLPLGTTLIRHQAFNKKDPNTAIYNHYEVGPTEIRLKVIGQLLSDIMSEPLFDFLRTQKQIGYYVGCSQTESNGIIGFYLELTTQKSKFSADDVDDLMEEFLLYFQNKMQNFTEEEFQKYVEAYVKDCRAADFCLSDEVDRHWQTIDKEEYLFDLSKKKCEIVMTVTKKEVENYLYTYLIDKNKRKKLCLQIIGHHDHHGDDGDTSDSDSSDGDESSGSESETGEEERPDKMKCPEDFEIEGYSFVNVPPNSQYDRCITDVYAFAQDCGYHPHTKLKY